MTVMVRVCNLDNGARIKVGELCDGEIQDVHIVDPKCDIEVAVHTHKALVVEEIDEAQVQSDDEGDGEPLVGPVQPQEVDGEAEAASIEAIAKACHEANREYCQSIGDDSQPPWDDAPDWQKASAIAGVQAVISNPSMTPEDSHNSWLMMKAAKGWVYGEVKDPEAKTHPCMVDYADLPEEHKRKDAIFLRTVREMIGYSPDAPATA